MFIAGHVEGTFKGHRGGHNDPAYRKDDMRYEAARLRHGSVHTFEMYEEDDKAEGYDRKDDGEYGRAPSQAGDVLHGRDARNDDDEGGGEESHDCADSFDRGSYGAHPDCRGAAVDDGPGGKVPVSHIGGKAQRT